MSPSDPVLTHDLREEPIRERQPQGVTRDQVRASIGDAVARDLLHRRVQVERDHPVGRRQPAEQRAGQAAKAGRELENRQSREIDACAEVDRGRIEEDRRACIIFECRSRR